MLRVDENYYISADRYNFILSQRREQKEGSDKERWKDIGYFGNLETLLKHLVYCEVRGTGLADLETVVKKMEEITVLVKSLPTKEIEKKLRENP